MENYPCAIIKEKTGSGKNFKWMLNLGNGEDFDEKQNICMARRISYRLLINYKWKKKRNYTVEPTEHTVTG